jgi:hypothetical protein
MTPLAHQTLILLLMFMMMSKRCFDGNNFDFNKRSNNTCEHFVRKFKTRKERDLLKCKEMYREIMGCF